MERSQAANLPPHIDEIRQLEARILAMNAELCSAQRRLAELRDGCRGGNDSEERQLRIDPPHTLASIASALTEREYEVLMAYVRNPNGKQIARDLGIKVQTVRNQIASIEHKLRLTSREHLIAAVLAAWYEARLHG